MRPHLPEAILIGGGLIFAAIGIALTVLPAWAGEYEIVRFAKGQDYDKAPRTHDSMGALYKSKTECDIAITRIHVALSGVRLQCLPKIEFATRGFAATAPTDRF